MTFTYEFGGDDDFWGGEIWEYEVDDRKLKEALVKILCGNTKDKHKSLYAEDGNYQMANFVVYELDILDVLCEQFEDELKDYFYNDAQNDYINYRD